MTIVSRAFGAAALALVVLAPVAASAQQQRNPFSQLFGEVPERDGNEFTAVQFRSTAGVQVGQTLEQRSPEPESAIPDGIAGVADASLIAQYMRTRLQVSSLGRFSYQEFRRGPAYGAPAYDAGVSANYQPTTQLSFQGGGSFARSPYFRLLWLGPDPAALVPVDRSALLLMENEIVEGTAGVTSQYTRRSSLNVSGIARQIRFEASPQLNYTSVGGRARWKRQMTRDLAIHAGYGREELRQRLDGVNNIFTNELLDIGVDYAQSLSLARRTSLSFGTETSILSQGEGSRRFRLNGHVLLERHFRRTWKTQLGARRDTEFLPGFRAPVFTQHGHFTIAGYPAKRLALSVSAEGGQGEVGFNDSRKFISYGAGSRLTVAITRHLGLFTQYLYYHYQTPADPRTLFLVPSGARQAVSVGVQAWVSILEKVKVSRDPR